MIAVGTSVEQEWRVTRDLEAVGYELVERRPGGRGRRQPSCVGLRFERVSAQKLVAESPPAGAPAELPYRNGQTT